MLRNKSCHRSCSHHWNRWLGWLKGCCHMYIWSFNYRRLNNYFCRDGLISFLYNYLLLIIWSNELGCDCWHQYLRPFECLRSIEWVGGYWRRWDNDLRLLKVFNLVILRRFFHFVVILSRNYFLFFVFLYFKLY